MTARIQGLPDTFRSRGGGAELNLEEAAGSFRVHWYDPRAGGELRQGSTREVRGPGMVSLGAPPSEPAADWVILLRR